MSGMTPDPIIRERVALPIIEMTGRVKVELFDADTGRLVHREEGQNFLTQLALEHARWAQRMMWGRFSPLAPAITAEGVTAFDAPYFPAEHLALWTDAAAEDQANEHAVRGSVVAWASRHPVGSPTGKRGVVNIAESEFTDEHARWVFDWVTSQGNGTFRSVGWTRLQEASETPIGRNCEPDTRVTFTGGVGATQSNLGGLHWDGAQWLTIDQGGASTGQYRLMSAAELGGAWAVVFTIPNFLDRASSSDSNHMPAMALCKFGADFIIVGETMSGGATQKPRIGRLNSAGVEQWTVTASEIADSNCFNDVTTDGVNLFAACSNGTIYRINPANGARTATITPANGLNVAGIVFDSADGNFWCISTTLVVFKMDGSGNVIATSPVFSVTTSSQSVASTAPWTGTYQVPPASMADPYVWVMDNDPFSPDAGEYMNRSAKLGLALGQTTWNGVRTPLTMKGGLLYAASQGSRTSVVDGAGVLRGGSMATRHRLATDTTKSATQTMKVTYQFDFS